MCKTPKAIYSSERILFTKYVPVTNTSQMPEKTIMWKNMMSWNVWSILNLFGGQNVNCLRQTTFHEPIGVKYKKKITVLSVIMATQE